MALIAAQGDACNQSVFLWAGLSGGDRNCGCVTRARCEPSPHGTVSIYRPPSHFVSALPPVTAFAVDPPAASLPLPLCGGDCDTDADCEGGLGCFQRAEGSHAAVPGCAMGAEQDGDRAGWDFCAFLPTAAGGPARYGNGDTVGCISCPAGRTVDVAVATGCNVVCPAGSWSAAGAACTVCGNGRYSAQAEATAAQACIACPLGRLAGSTNGAAAQDKDELSDCGPVCAPGRYIDAIAQTACKACALGTVAGATAGALPSDHDAASDCGAVCPAGRFKTDLSAAQTCEACPAGTFLEDAGAVAAAHDQRADCTVCAAGRFSEATGAALAPRARRGGPTTTPTAALRPTGRRRPASTRWPTASSAPRDGTSR
jgi:hypothetical protein